MQSKNNDIFVYSEPLQRCLTIESDKKGQLSLVFRLTPLILDNIEKYRFENDNKVEFKIHVNTIYFREGSSKSNAHYVSDPDGVIIIIPQSDWIGYLNQMKNKKYVIVEISMPNNENIQEFTTLLDIYNNALQKRKEGNTLEVMVLCRQIIDELRDIIKKNKDVFLRSINKNSRPKTRRNFNKKGERIIDILWKDGKRDQDNKKIGSDSGISWYLGIGAHPGEFFPTIRDADFSLNITLACLKYLIEELQVALIIP